MSELRDREMLRAVFDTAADAIVVFDRETFELIDVNPAACELYGYDREELLGLTLLDLTAEPELTRGTVARRDVRIVDRRHRRRDGSAFPVNVTANWFVLEGRPIGVGFVHDVTDRERSARALEASEAKFAAAFRTSPDSVNINRLSDGLYLEINDGFTKLTGYSAADVAGKTSSEIAIWADPACRETLVAGLKESGEVTNLEAGFRRKDGSVTTALMSARVISVEGVDCILSVTRDISERKAALEALRTSNEQLSSIVRDVAEAMGRAVEKRDPYTSGHQVRVARVARLIGLEMGLPEHEADALEIAGLLHDVGKLGVPAEILNKPGALSDAEFSLIHTHSRQGFDILKDIPFPWPVAEMVLQHHERVDGSGYPNGLRGDDILPTARILAVADVIDATASHRPYRQARGVPRAVEELLAEASRHDAVAVGACRRLYERGALAFLSE